MDRTYNVGASNTAITFEIRTGTAATCFTAAYQVLPGGQRIRKGESPDAANGAIDNTPLGKGGDLKNSKLSIQTFADFSALPDAVFAGIKNDSHALKSAIKIEYLFDGGGTGAQTFDYDYDDYVISAISKMVVVTKIIALLP